jgi:predicted glutamine amidotransferase
MCGIGGLSLYPKNRNKVELVFIRELISALAVENEVRGTHATGVAVFHKDGAKAVLKSDTTASLMVDTKAWNGLLDRQITNDTTNVLIHTRFATKGSITNNNNNHPIITETVIGVHNGMIYNDDELFATKKLQRIGQVDSEILFRLADHYAPTGNMTKENMKSIAEEVSGVFAVAMVQKSNPSVLQYFRSDNPTTFAYIPKLNILVFASQKKFITEAIDTANLQVAYLYKESLMIEQDSLVFFEPNKNSIYQFDVSHDTALIQLEQEPLSFEENYDGWLSYGYYGGTKVYGDGYYDDDWYNDYQTSRTGYSTNSSKIDSKYSKQEEVNDLWSYLEKHEDKFGDDFKEIQKLFTELESNAWIEGYTQGRQSTDLEHEVKKELANDFKEAK